MGAVAGRILAAALLLAASAAGVAGVRAGGAPPESERELLERIRKEHDLPALAAAVVLKGKTASVEAVGVRRHGDATPVQAGDRFHLGSCTKSMTATLIGILVEEGRLRWETTLAEALPDLRAGMRPEYRSVTLEQLLRHRGGFPALSWPKGKSFLDVHALPGSPRAQRRAYVEMIVGQEPDAAPGTRYIYSNAGYAAVGAAAERAAGAEWETLMERRLFRPLGITTAGFGAMGTPGKIDQPWQHLVEGPVRRAIPPGPRADNPAAIGPAGTVHASLADWARYVAAHLAGARGRDGLLRAATFRRLHEPAPGEEYALGWQAVERGWGGGRVLTHSGSNRQNFAVVWMAPRRDFAVLAATNQGGEAAAKACDQVAAAMIGRYLK